MNSETPYILMGRPVQTVQMIGRASASKGIAAFTLAAKDLWGSAEVLARHGVDCRPHLPPVDDLVGMLRAAKPMRSEVDGKVFHNRFVDIDMREECGVYAILSAGTGRKLDDQLLQPFVVYCAEVAKDIRPGLLFGKRFDRLARNAWAMAPLMQVINTIPRSLVGDERRGIIESGPVTDMVVFVESRMGEDEADKMPLKTRRGMRDATESVMVNGRAICGFAGAVPPGFGRARLRSGAGAGPAVLYIDAPTTRPKASEVAFGLSTVVTADGQPVDQAENVRWALRALAEGLSHRQVAEGLVVRRYSTDQLRRRQGPSAVHSLSRSPWNITGSILKRLDLYETGELVFDTGIAGVDPIVIRECFPMQGQWAAPEVFAAIRERMAHGVQRHSDRAQRTFTGLRISIGEQSYTLRHYYWRGSDYSLRPAQGNTGPLERGAIVPHEELAAMVRAGVTAAGTRLIEAVDASTARGSLIEEAQVAETRIRLATLENRRARIVDELDETDAAGERIVTGPLLQRRTEEYRDIAESITEAEEKLARLEQTILMARRRENATRKQAHTDQLLHMIASLRDPADLTYRDLWKSTITDVEMKSERFVVAGYKGRAITLSGSLTFQDGNELYTIPMRHQFQTGAAAPAQLKDHVARVINEMADGTPFSRVRGRKPSLLALIAQELGTTPARLYEVHIDDPMLLRTVFAAVHRRNGRDAAAIAAEVQTPVELVERVQRVHAEQSEGRRIIWRFGGLNETQVALYAIAAQNDGVLTADLVVPRLFSTWQDVTNRLRARPHASEWEAMNRGGPRRLKPCGNCGSYRQAPTDMMFIQGLLCLDCLRDRGGLQWREEDRRYVLHPHIWQLDVT